MSRLPLPVGVFGIGGFSSPHHHSQPILQEVHDKRSSDGGSIQTSYGIQQRKIVRLVNDVPNNNNEGSNKVRDGTSLISGMKSDSFSTSSSANRFANSITSGKTSSSSNSSEDTTRRSVNETVPQTTFFSQNRTSVTNSVLGGSSSPKVLQSESISSTTIKGPSINTNDVARPGHNVINSDTSHSSLIGQIQSSENDDHASNNYSGQGGRNTSVHHKNSGHQQNHGGVYNNDQQQQFMVARQQQHMMLMQQQQQQQQQQQPFRQPQLYNPLTGRLDSITPSQRGGGNSSSQRAVSGPVPPFMTRTGNSSFDQEHEKRVALRASTKKNRGPRSLGLKFVFSADGDIVCKDNPDFSSDAALVHKVLKEEQSQSRKVYEDVNSKDLPSPLLSGMSSSAGLGGPNHGSDGGDGNLAELLLGSQLLSEAVGEESIDHSQQQHTQGLKEYNNQRSFDGHQTGIEGNQYHHQIMHSTTLHNRYSHEDGKDTFLGSFLQSSGGPTNGGGPLGMSHGGPSQDQISTWQLQQQQMQQQHQNQQQQSLDQLSSGVSSFSFNRSEELGGISGSQSQSQDLWAASQGNNGFGGGSIGNPSFGGQQQNNLLQIQQSPWGSSFLNQQPPENHLTSFGDSLGGGSGGWASFGNFNADVNSTSLNNDQGGSGGVGSNGGTFLRLESFSPQENATTDQQGAIWDSNVLPYLSGGQTEALTAAAASYFQQQQQQQQQQQTVSQSQVQKPQNNRGGEGSSPNNRGGSRGGGRGGRQQRGRGGGGGY
jgi:hypothetical protein